MKIRRIAIQMGLKTERKSQEIIGLITLMSMQIKGYNREVYDIGI